MRRSVASTESLLNKPRSKGVQSRLQIIAAAKTLILQRGFIGVTVQDILEAAHVTKGKFFHHFSSKEDLFSELLRDTLNARSSMHFADVVEDCKDDEPFEILMFLLDKIIERHKAGLSDEMRLCLFATLFFSPGSPEIRRVKGLLAENCSVVAKLISKCQDRTQLPTEINPESFALLVPSSAVGGNLVGYLVSNKEGTVQNLLQIKKILSLMRAQSKNSMAKRRSR